MGVDFPCTFRNASIAVPIQLNVESLYLLVLIGNDGLFIASGEQIPVSIVPGACLIWLVVGEFPLIKCPIGECPPTLLNGVVFPFA